MSTMTATNWKAMAEQPIPDDRMDGRDMLLWAGYAAICSWCDGWRDTVGKVVTPTHWDDVEGPSR